MSDDNHWRILITDISWPAIGPEIDILARAGGEITQIDTLEEADLLPLAPDFDAIMTCWAPITAAVIESAPRLQVIARYGIGLDNVDLEAATARGVIVTNTPTYCLEEVSDHAMALILACARKICHYNATVHAGDWSNASGLPMFRLRGQTLGILGFGRIGQKLAPRGKAFGLRVLAHDPFVAPEVFAALGCEQVDLDTLFAEADFISIHAPLTPDTRGIVNAQRLRRMKPTAFIVNTARGGLIDQEALVAALEQGWIAGAGLDVFTPERLPPGHPLLQLPNVIATPHTAYYSEQALLDLEIQTAEAVAAVLSGHRPTHVVNRRVLAHSRWSHLQ
jgi:D-3-phosphoglycerate dehydrogenase